MDRKRVVVVTNVLRTIGIGLMAWGVATDRVDLIASAFGLRAPFFVAAIAFAIATALVWTAISNESIEDARSQSPAL